MRKKLATYFQGNNMDSETITDYFQIMAGAIQASTDNELWSWEKENGWLVDESIEQPWWATMDQNDRAMPHLFCNIFYASATRLILCNSVKQVSQPWTASVDGGECQSDSICSFAFTELLPK